MESSSSRIDVAPLAEEAHVLQLRTVEVARDRDLFTSQNSNLLALQQLLGNDRRQTPKEVILAVDDDGLVVKSHSTLQE